MKLAIGLSRFAKPKRFVRIYLLIFVLVFLIITGFAYQNKALSLHFVDEENNFFLGKQLLVGDKLYSEQFSNHQPLAPIVSSAIQGVTEPNSIFLLVKRHREFVILYSAVWSAFLVLRFGWPLLLFVIIYELNKIFLLGNLFLAEALIIYPFVYIMSFVLFKAGGPQWPELVLLGASFALIFFLLAPLWPLIFLLFLALLFQSKKRFTTLKFVSIGALPILIISFLFSSIPDYFYQSIFINLKYFPIATFALTPISLLKSFFAPLLSFFVSGEQGRHTLTITQALSLFLLINIFLLLRKRKFYLVISLIFILFLSNLRYIEPGQEFYRGFHLLPWFSVLILLVVITNVYVFQNYYQNIIRFSLAIFFIVILGLSFNNARMNLFKKSDMTHDLYVNYSRQFSIGEAIKITSSGDRQNNQETLFVMPDEWLIYWQSGLKPPTKLNVWFGWMNNVPDLNREFNSMWSHNKPTYFYCDCDSINVVGYKEIIKHGKPSRLYVLVPKLQTLTREQISQLNFYGFTVN
jgi:hypothetical protein